MSYTGGQRGIRTPEGLATSTVFKTVAFNHSAICPKLIPTVFQPGQSVVLTSLFYIISF